VVGEALAQAYNREIAGVGATVVPIPGGVDESFAALKAGQADVVFVDSETAYVGYRSSTGSAEGADPKVRAIAVLFPTAVHVLVRRALRIQGIAGLKGHRIAVGARGGYADQAFEQILNSYSLDYKTVAPVFELTSNTKEDLHRGALDGVVFYVPILSRSVFDLVQSADLHLLSIERKRIAAIQGASERSHFFKSMLVSKGTYPHQDKDVLTIGQDFLLLCRDDLPDALVYQLTKVLFDSVDALARAHPAAGSIYIERGPTAVVPLHRGAARFYRQHELPK
jgi:TRAP transporter TAXI family solute receptor